MGSLDNLFKYVFNALNFRPWLNLGPCRASYFEHQPLRNSPRPSIQLREPSEQWLDFNWSDDIGGDGDALLMRGGLLTDLLMVFLCFLCGFCLFFQFLDVPIRWTLIVA